MAQIEIGQLATVKIGNPKDPTHHPLGALETLVAIPTTGRPPSAARRADSQDLMSTRR